jgi:4-hydroxy-3-polyprenylbenzoate decarboxylase
MMPEAVIAITGASGAVYAERLLRSLSDAGWEVLLIVTHAGAINLDLELGMKPEDNDNLAARSASGSAKIDHYVICPASGTTIGKLAAGISDNLVTRSAMVALKERRPLIIVPREAPYATVHLENMTKLSTWGVVVLPASPGFYSQPTTIADLVDFVVARILDQMGVEHALGRRWTGEEVQ